MASPKTVGQFYVETTRQTAKNAASAQDAFVRYADELAGVGKAYLSAWSSTQQLSLQTAFQLQNAAIQASQAMLDASAQANLSLFDEWAKAVADGQVAMTKLLATGVSMLDNAMPRRVG